MYNTISVSTLCSQHEGIEVRVMYSCLLIKKGGKLALYWMRPRINFSASLWLERSCWWGHMSHSSFALSDCAGSLLSVMPSMKHILFWELQNLLGGRSVGIPCRWSKPWSAKSRSCMCCPSGMRPAQSISISIAHNLLGARPCKQLSLQLPCQSWPMCRLDTQIGMTAVCPKAGRFVQGKQLWLEAHLRTCWSSSWIVSADVDSEKLACRQWQVLGGGLAHDSLYLTPKCQLVVV